MESGLLKDFSFLDGNRRYKAIFLLLLRAENVKTSEALAAELKVTSRTIKNDLKQMKLKLAEIGIQLLSERAKGYRLVIEDGEQNDIIKEMFQIYQPAMIDSDFDTRVQYIIRRFLVGEAPIKVETLQQELYRNTTNSIHRELAQAKSFFAQYRLKIFVKPHHGMWLEGDNFYKTICLIRMYRYFNRKISPEFNIDSFNQLFRCGETEKERIRQVLLSVLTSSRIVFSDLYVERFLVYLIYFRNRALSGAIMEVDFPACDFAYTCTDEYRMVRDLCKTLNDEVCGFVFSEAGVKFLTVIAIISTDLYRFKDCTHERYGSLIDMAKETADYIQFRFSAYFNADMTGDQTGTKDLRKVMIPISLKIKLRLSDDVDLGFHHASTMVSRPVLRFFIQKLGDEFFERYGYRFSAREQYLIFNIFLGIVNRIVLPHDKLKLAVIAIDGRLSTQQLKFNLQHHFSEFIDKIETKVLYELNAMKKPQYDYYLCMEYGKNMKIDYKPIYFADEGMTEREYVAALKNIFFNAYGYDRILPAIEYMQIADKHKFNVFPIEEYLDEAGGYERITIGCGDTARLYLKLNCGKESVRIFYFAHPDDITLYGEKYFIIVSMKIDDDKYKLKMMLNVLDRVSANSDILFQQCRVRLLRYKDFFAQM